MQRVNTKFLNNKLGRLGSAGFVKIYVGHFILRSSMTKLAQSYPIE